MTRVTSVFLCALLTTAWSVPTEAAAQEDRIVTAPPAAEGAPPHNRA